MRTRLLSEVAAAVGGSILGENVAVSSVVVDGREASPGSLFFALTGRRTDGHAFVGQAFARGAAAAVVSRAEPGDAPGPLIVVADTGEALLSLAADERSLFSGTVVGITGSTGKTTTKDLAAAVLSVRYRVRSSPASFNNQVGVPLTVLSTDQEAEAIVCEIGASAVGEIARLCTVARPRIGVVTNVGVAHLEGFGSRENVARAKGELVEALPEDGVAVLNGDDPVVRGFTARTAARPVLFGTGSDADVRGEDVSLDDRGQPRFTLVAGGNRETVELAIAGEHMVPNALAAAACGIALGLSPAECAAALKEARASAWRMEVFTTPGGIVVLNDAYNANPASMGAALKSARWMSRGARCIAVLGSMAELGPISLEEHEHVGELVARLGIERLVTVGGDAVHIARGAVREGVEPHDVASYEDVEPALDDVRRHARPGDVVLVKGSRVAGLERLAEALR
jgi:UDP-N-acetylmuramoyl-tripeptide--D-alanyl-D-alanine ligase